jgi:hypothetical protein
MSLGTIGHGRGRRRSRTVSRPLLLTMWSGVEEEAGTQAVGVGWKREVLAVGTFGGKFRRSGFLFPPAGSTLQGVPAATAAGLALQRSPEFGLAVSGLSAATPVLVRVSVKLVRPWCMSSAGGGEVGLLYLWVFGVASERNHRFKSSRTSVGDPILL